MAFPLPNPGGGGLTKFLKAKNDKPQAASHQRAVFQIQ
jgi:hypothetical protein